MYYFPILKLVKNELISLNEQARDVPEMQKPRTLCGAIVARPGHEPVL
jgi:hypothetical protein